MNKKITIAIAVLVIGAGMTMFLVGVGMGSENSRTARVVSVTDVVYIEGAGNIFGGEDKVVRIASHEALVEILQASQAIEDRANGGSGSRVIVDSDSFMMEDSAMVDEGVSFAPAMDWTESLMNSDTMMDQGVASAPGVERLSAGKTQDSPDHSTTNVQVRGVDEPDYIKNDGKYVYIVDDNTLSIIDAYPSQDAVLVLKTAIDVGSENINDMFLNGDRLVIFYNGESLEEIIPEFGFAPQSTYVQVTHALILDIADRENPSILKDYSIGGHFVDARMIGSHAYFVTNSQVDHHNPRLPAIHEGSRHVMTPDAFYFDNPERLSSFSTLTAIDVFGDDISSKSYLMGRSGTHYVSGDNFYLTYLQNNNLHNLFVDTHENRFYDAVVPLLPNTIQERIMAVRADDSLSSPEQWAEVSGILQEFYGGIGEHSRRDLFRSMERSLAEYDSAVLESAGSATKTTVIHKIAIDGTEIEYVAKGSVPGRLLNQFSMDEHGDRFRVATTADHRTLHSGVVRENAVYVLDEEMNTVGGLGNIAPNESIFSARFMDDRLYLVTFRQIDPFFVIDLSKDTPKILGELKIPGFSNYLHPFDDEHVIGIGRSAQMGVKIALFNVADVSNPKVADEVVIGDRRTQSEALDNHKAFFLGKGASDGDGRILSVPITGSIKSLGVLQDQKRPDWIQSDGEVSWSGFYVFDLDASDGFDLRGTITHWEGVRNSPGHLKMDHHARTFYIEDVLYTTSERFLKMNSLDTLDVENSIMLKNTGGLIRYLDERAEFVFDG